MKNFHKIKIYKIKEIKRKVVLSRTKKKCKYLKEFIRTLIFLSKRKLKFAVQSSHYVICVPIFESSISTCDKFSVDFFSHYLLSHKKSKLKKFSFEAQKLCFKWFSTFPTFVQFNTNSIFGEFTLFEGQLITLCTFVVIECLHRNTRLPIIDKNIVSCITLIPFLLIKWILICFSISISAKKRKIITKIVKSNEVIGDELIVAISQLGTYVVIVADWRLGDTSLFALLSDLGESIFEEFLDALEFFTLKFTEVRLALPLLLGGGG